MRTAAPWQDPRTNIWHLRKRIPTRLRAASGRSGDVVKISLGTADRAAALKQWPAALARFDRLVADWERAANVVELTPETAAGLAAGWAAWIAGDPSRLDRCGESSALFDNGAVGRIVAGLEGAFPGRNATRAERLEGRLEAHAIEAASLVSVTVSPGSLPALKAALRPVVKAAYRQAELHEAGIPAGAGPRWEPLGEARKALPAAADVPAANAPATSLRALYDGWKATAAVKPRTVTETGYILDLFIRHLGHEDAARLTRADFADWRSTLKADGKTNTTWNNRLSHVRQLLEWGVTEGRLPTNVADAKLRLKKQKGAQRLPYSDEEVVRILTAARQEARPSMRWAPWLMAFSGMRVAEVLQLGAADIRQEDGVWFMAIHEDRPGLSVKTGQRRSVPIHPRVIEEGFLTHWRGLASDGPLFPDKAVDAHGQRGARGWNVTGKWVRQKVGITDPAKAPNHSFRHRMEDELRAAEVPQDVRDAILGHATKSTGRLYGVRGEALKRLAEGIGRVTVPGELRSL